MIPFRLLRIMRPPRYTRQVHTLLHQKLDAAADMLLSSSPAPTGVSPYERVALGTLAVFARSCSFYALPSKENKPQVLIEGGDVWSGVTFLDAVETIHRLCVSVQLEGRKPHSQQKAQATSKTKPLAHRIYLDPRFSLLLQCTSYHLSRGIIAPSNSGVDDEIKVQLSSIAQCMLDLCLLAREEFGAPGNPQPSKAQLDVLVNQLSDAFCQMLPRLQDDDKMLELSLLPSLDALRAVSHWNTGTFKNPPLAALDALAVHFIKMSSFSPSIMGAQTALVFIEAAALFQWWDKIGGGLETSVATTIDGPQSTNGRYSYALRTLFDAISDKFPSSLPHSINTISLQRCAHQCLFILTQNNAQHLEPAGVFSALLCLIKAGGLNGRSHLYPPLTLSSFSPEELISSLCILSQSCTPAHLTTKGLPFNANAVCTRNALMRNYVLELQSRVQAYESDYLSKVLLGGGGPLGFVEPGASLSACNQRRLYLKKYTASGMKKLVNDDGGILFEGFREPPSSHLVLQEAEDASAVKSLFVEALQGCGHFLPPLPESRFNKMGTDNLVSQSSLSPSQLFIAMGTILPLCAAPIPTSELSPGDAALSRAAFSAAMTLCDLAIVQALAGESSGRDECALAGLCAEGGLQHRGFFSAMGRRMVGRGSNRGVNPRLSTIPTPLIISLLHALCMAWEFDEDAFTMAIIELQVRDAAGEWDSTSESPKGEGAEEKGTWGERGALSWKEANFFDRVFRGANVEMGKALPFSSASVLSPVPDFLWDRGSSIDWTDQSGALSNESNISPLDFKTAWKLHQILTTLGTVTKFPQLVWQVPRSLRELALSVSPFIHPWPTSPAFTFNQQLPFKDEPGKVSSAPSVGGYIPSPPLNRLSHHCITVLMSSIPAGTFSIINPSNETSSGSIAPSSFALSWFLKKGLSTSYNAHSRQARVSKELLHNKSNRRGKKIENKSFASPVMIDPGELSLRASTYLDLLKEPQILEALKEDGLIEMDDVREALAAPLYASDSGVVIHVALPYHRVALEFVGPGGAMAYAPYSSPIPLHDSPASNPPSTPALLSLQVMWRAGLLRATGWTVVFIPVPLLSSQWVHSITREGGCTVASTPNPLNTVSVLAKVLPASLHKSGPIKT